MIAKSKTFTLTLRYRKSGRVIKSESFKRGVYSPSTIAAHLNNNLSKAGNYTHRWGV